MRAGVSTAAGLGWEQRRKRAWVRARRDLGNAALACGPTATRQDTKGRLTLYLPAARPPSQGAEI
eukprot:365150-Chlamydomonas_euryale.AAC.3